MNNKILVIGSTPPPYNGMSVVTENILNSDLRKRFNIINLDTADRRSLSNIGKIDFINVYLAIKHFLKFLWLCMKEKPKVVYLPISQGIWGYLRDCLFLVPAKLFHRKVIIHLHGGYFRDFYEQSNKITKLLICWTLKDVNKAIVLGENLRYIFHGLIPQGKIAVVPNGVDENLFVNCKSNIVKKKKNQGRILYLSSLMRNKGFIDIMNAIPEVVKYHKDVEFIFAGELRVTEPEEKEIHRIINSNALNSCIKFLGTVTGEEKIKLLLSSHIFVFPSHNEGQPFAILEGMAAELPIITTDTGTIKEMVIDGENGFIVVKKNPEQIAEKIILLLGDEKLRRRMGKRSRERFLKHYTKDKFIENLTKVFEKVLSNGHRKFTNIS